MEFDGFLLLAAELSHLGWQNRKNEPLREFGLRDIIEFDDDKPIKN
jgi:hypothetical protein